MTRCDCGVFESCDVCIALAQRDLGPYTAEDYARHHRIAIDPAAPDGHDETVILACKFNEDGQAIAMEILER